MIASVLVHFCHPLPITLTVNTSRHVKVLSKARRSSLWRWETETSFLPYSCQRVRLQTKYEVSPFCLKVPAYAPLQTTRENLGVTSSNSERSFNLSGSLDGRWFLFPSYMLLFSFQCPPVTLSCALSLALSLSVPLLLSATFLNERHFPPVSPEKAPLNFSISLDH